MKYLLIFFLYSCSQVSLKKEEAPELVSLDAALNHAFASYMKGCVDTYKDLQLPVSFELCRDKAKEHIREVREIMDQIPQVEQSLN